MNEASPRVELSAPDIGPYRAGNTGVEWVTRLRSDAPGPTLAVVAAMHGNELCGPIVVDLLMRSGFRPRCGTLLLAFANVAAYLTFDPDRPSASRFLDEDMNRVWDDSVLDGGGTSTERARARAILPLLEEADAILDLHSMLHPSDPLMLCGPSGRGADLARALGHPGWVVADGGHAAGKRLIDRPAFVDPAGTRVAILAECGQHWETAAAEVAIEVSARFLAHFGLAGPDLLADRRRPVPPAPQTMVRVTAAVTATSERFRFVEPFEGLEIVPRAGTLIAWDGDREVRTPEDDCVLIMPSRRCKPGQTAVRLGRIVR